MLRIGTIPKIWKILIQTITPPGERGFARRGNRVTMQAVHICFSHPPDPIAPTCTPSPLPTFPLTTDH